MRQSSYDWLQSLDSLLSGIKQEVIIYYKKYSNNIKWGNLNAIDKFLHGRSLAVSRKHFQHHREGQRHLKRQENRSVIAWCGAASAGLVSSTDRAYMKAPRPSSHAGLRDKMSRTYGNTHEKADGFFSQNGNGREAIFRAFPP